jgi:hypothetical protein
MKLAEVRDKSSKKLFHKLPSIIYKNDPNYIQPLINMVESTFDPLKNSFFKHGKSIRWVLLDSDKNPIGRIAAFIDYDKSHTFEQPTGNIGFFECINDKEASTTLFNTAREWLKQNGMEAMDGPANIGENYMNHGLLVSGFTQQGFGMPYNPAYYLDLYECYGFKTYYEQYAYHIDYTKPFPERFWKIAEWVAKKPQFSFRHFNWKDTSKFVDDFAEIYDGAWQKHEHYKPLDKEELRNFLISSKLLIDPEFIWFAYSNEKPIALFVMLPDFNQVLKKIKTGRLSLWNLIKLFSFIKGKKFTRARIIIMGVVESFQKSGIESAIFWHLENHVMPHKPRYTEIELSWAGDFNPKIIAIYKATGGIHAKTYYQLRYLFDRDKKFERCKIIE